MDFSGDGKVDLLVSLAMDNRVALLTGNGDGTFNMPVSYSAGMQPAGLALGDVNGNYGSTYIGWGAATCRRSNHGHRNRSDRSDRSDRSEA